MRNTHFGAYWNVVSKPDPMNLAYTGAQLGLHTDLPFYQVHYRVEGVGLELLSDFAVHPRRAAAALYQAGGRPDRRGQPVR